MYSNICLFTFLRIAKGHSSMPAFASPISSLTVAKGRDATLKCVVDNLGDYRVIENVTLSNAN